MSFATQFHVPGAFTFDGSSRRPPLNSSIYRPPISPSASSYNLARSTGSLYSDISMTTTAAGGTAKRKRMSTRETTPVDWSMNMDGANDATEEQRTPAEGRQFRYTLAGQISTTPAAGAVGAGNGLLEDSVYSDVDYRRSLGPTRLAADDTDSRMVDANGLKNEQSGTLSSPGWSLFTLHTIGDVMGKVWEFCKNGAFRGFQAGGGKGYEANGTVSQTEVQATGGPPSYENDLPTPPNDESPGFGDVPGQFTPSNHRPYSPEPSEISTPESTPRPAAKRRQVSMTDELRNWVVVDEPQQQARRPAEAKPTRPRLSTSMRPRTPGYYSQTAASSGRRINVPVSRLGSGTPSVPRGARPSLRISHAGSPDVASLREPASFAPSRSPIVASPIRATPSRIPLPVQSAGAPHSPLSASFSASAVGGVASRPSSRQSLVRPSSRLQHHHHPHHQMPAAAARSPVSSSHRYSHSAVSAVSGAAANMASPRRSRSELVDVDDIQASPRLDAEAKQLAQKKLAAERDVDMRVDAFNAQLMSMIRQGREALGTRVEVFSPDEETGPGGGWEDDD